MTRIRVLKSNVEKARTALYMDVSLLNDIEELAEEHDTSLNKMCIALIEHALLLDAEAKAAGEK